MLVACSVACSHPVKVVSREDKRVVKGNPVVSTRVAAGELDISDSGRLRVAVGHVSKSEQQVEIQTWGNQTYNEWTVGATIGKYIILPIGIALFGILLFDPGGSDCDHNGDGRVNLVEYFRDLEAWFNPFEAGPRDWGRRMTRRIPLESKLEPKITETRKPAPGHPIEVRLQADSEFRSIRRKTDTAGNAEVDLAPYLWLLGPRQLDIDVIIGDPEVDRKSRILTDASVGAILRSRRDAAPSNALDENGKPILPE